MGQMVENFTGMNSEKEKISPSKDQGVDGFEMVCTDFGWQGKTDNVLLNNRINDIIKSYLVIICYQIL